MPLLTSYATDPMEWGDPDVTCRHHRFADSCDLCYEEQRDDEEAQWWDYHLEGERRAGVKRYPLFDEPEAA